MGVRVNGPAAKGNGCAILAMPAMPLLLLVRKGQTNKGCAEMSAKPEDFTRAARRRLFSSAAERQRHLRTDERPNHSYENDMFVKIPRCTWTRPQTDAVEHILVCVTAI